MTTHNDNESPSSPIGSADLEQVLRTCQERLLAQQQVREAMERTLDRLDNMQQINAALAHASTSERIAEISVKLGACALGAYSGALALLAEEDALTIICSIDFEQEEPSVAAALPPILEQAVRTLAPVEVSPPDGSQALMAAPLEVYGRAIGGLGFSFAPSHPFHKEDRAFLLALSEQAAQALERVRRYETERLADH